MILARNIRCITNVARNVLATNGGYVAPARAMSFKSDLFLKITWNKPKKIKSYYPEKSGDGGLDLKVTPKDYCNFFDKSKELNDADKLVKQMFTLEFAPRREIQNKKREEALARVKRHAADRGSMESRLAAMTAEIHNLQEHMSEHPKNIKAKLFLKELIDKRKKFLGKLRRWDYKRFEWILEKLNLVYKPHPPEYKKITRKYSLRQVTMEHCQKLREQKLKQYEEELANKKKSFLMEKAEQLEFIRNEEIACEKEPTVTEEEIANVRALIEQFDRSTHTQKRTL